MARICPKVDRLAAMGTLIPERLKEQRKRAGFSQSELARRAGIGQSSVNRIEAGETLHPRNILEIARVLGTTPEYLTGETDNPAITGAAERALGWGAVPTERQPDPDLVEIAQIDMRYGLGGTFVDGPVVEKPRQFSRAWLRQFTHASPEHLVWALGDGDSMEPTIRDGEVILIDRSRDTLNMADAIWACTLGDIGMIKRLRPLPDGSVKVLSDNPSVPSETAVDGELHIIGRVVAVVRRL